MSNRKNTVEFELMPVVQSIFLMFGYLGVLVVGKMLLKEEFGVVLKWWITLALLGASCVPFTSLVFSGFHDGGYLFSKSIGLALSGWLLWALSSLHILKFTRTSCIVAVVIVVALNIAFWIVSKKKEPVKNWIGRVVAPSEYTAARKVLLALTFELFFLTLFVVGCYIKCFKPEAYGTEKFTDYGFMTSLMRTEYMPPEDSWASGTNLNYYYLGQYMSTFITKLSGVTVNVGYNLGLMMLMAFCFTLSYSLIYEVMRVTVKIRNEKMASGTKKNGRKVGIGAGFSAVLCHAAGALAGTAVTFAGNMHYTIYAKIIPVVQKIRNMEVASYWFPNSTRYIGHDPETNDKTIHEFPSYSFVLGDLHAHVTNTMFVLTVLGILFAWLLYRKKRMDAVRNSGTAEPYSRLLEVFHPAIILLGFFIGLFQTTNYWDFPIYFVVSGAVILFSNAIIHKFEKEALILTAFHAAVVVAMAVIVPFLFNIKFDSMAGGIALCTAHTPLYQLAVLWGLPVAVLTCYLVSTICKKKKEEPYKRKKGSKPLLFQFIGRLSLPELFIITIGLCAAGLVLLPEIIYVVDIYGESHRRSNTMFKFTYQAFIMFGLMMGYVITKFLLLAKNVKQMVCGVLTALLLFSTVGYLGKSIDSWFGDITDESRFQGLDAADFIENENVYDAEAVDWIIENIKGRPVMLEAWGYSFSYGNRISTLTGLPTILGWHDHEWLWKDNYQWVAARAQDVETIYTSTDAALVKELLEAYDVSYIYLGDEEHKRFEVNDALLQTLGEIVFRNDGAYIIKIK